jgi:hypothetical protein
MSLAFINFMHGKEPISHIFVWVKRLDGVTCTKDLDVYDNYKNLLKCGKSY